MAALAYASLGEREAEHLHFAEHFGRLCVVQDPATSGGTSVAVIHDLAPASPTDAKPPLILVEP